MDEKLIQIASVENIMLTTMIASFREGVSTQVDVVINAARLMGEAGRGDAAELCIKSLIAMNLALRDIANELNETLIHVHQSMGSDGMKAHEDMVRAWDSLFKE